MTSNIDINAYTNYLINQAQQYLPQSPAGATPTPAVTGPTPEGQAILDTIAKMGERTADQSSMNQVSNNLWDNAVNNVRRDVTGLVHFGTHLPEAGASFAEYMRETAPTGPQDIASSYTRRLTDLANSFLRTYNTKVEDFGKKSAGEIASNILSGIWENPVDTFLDFISFGGMKSVGKLTGADKASRVEQGLAVKGAETSQDVWKAYDELMDANKLAREKKVNMDEVLESVETGKRLGTAEQREVKAKLKQFSKSEDDIIAKYSPATHVGGEETAITQYILRTTEKKGVGTTYQQILQDVTPYLDELKAGNYDTVLDMAKKGDKVAKQVIAGKRLYDKGDIFPITHMRANVEKTGERIATQGDKLAQSVFARRAYGNATYKEIAKQFEKPETYFEDVIKTYSQKNVAKEIATSGTIGGQSILPNPNAKQVFLNRALLEAGDLKGALSELRESRVLNNDIPIDKRIAKELSKQTDIGGALHGYAGRIYNIGKGVNLASGGYLGPNLITGATNALLNSGMGLPADVLNAIRTKGSLAKQLGVYRINSQMPTGKDWLGNIEKINKTFGGQMMRQADRIIQNIFSEIGIHADLRKQGVAFGDRANALANMDKVKLGQVIIDAKRVANINSMNIPLPQIVTDTLFAFNPFWRWWVTSAQSSIRLLEKNPLLANVALMDICANIGFDREMQNRLQLGVSLDKPYVSYKIDPVTGQLKEHSAEFLTIGTPLKLLDLKEGYTYGPSIPVFTALINASQGKDRYGRPLKRIDKDGSITRTISGKRYRWTPGRGFEPEEIGMQADEMMSTAIKELIGPITLINRTIAPAMADVLNKDYGEYYQPYANRLFGDFDLNGGGDVMNPRTPEQVLGSFTGQYSIPYNPSREERGLYMSPSMQRQFWKSGLKQNQRLYQRLRMRQMTE